LTKFYRLNLHNQELAVKDLLQILCHVIVLTRGFAIAERLMVPVEMVSYS